MEIIYCKCLKMAALEFGFTIARMALTGIAAINLPSGRTTHSLLSFTVGKNEKKNNGKIKIFC
jgi:hypothetical protein